MKHTRTIVSTSNTLHIYIYTGTGTGRAGSEQLSMMCWNVCGWLRKNGGQYEQLNDEYDMRSAVIGFYSPDVVAVVESWLKGEDEAVVEGYKWFGNNR